jgi:hypothetical protein
VFEISKFLYHHDNSWKALNDAWITAQQRYNNNFSTMKGLVGSELNYILHEM